MERETALVGAPYSRFPFLPRGGGQEVRFFASGDNGAGPGISGAGAGHCSKGGGRG